MRYKSEDTKKLLEKLQKLGPELELINELGFRECGAIPDFFSLCCHWNKNHPWTHFCNLFLKSSAVDNSHSWTHLCNWLQKVPEVDLAWLDCEFRTRSRLLGLYDLKLNKDAPLMVRCLMSFACSGRTREAALKSLGNEFSGEELPYLLLRLNDWAGPVQDVAYKLVEDRLQRDEYVDFFILNLFLLDRLKQCLRGPHREFVSKVYDRIASCEPAEILKVIEVGARYAASAAFTLYEQVFPNELTSLVQSALRSTHPRLYLKCSSKIDALTNDDFMAVFPLLLQSRPPLRASATLSFCKRFPDEQIDFLKEMLLDQGAFVRDTVVWKLRKLDEGFDVALFYRESLKSKLSISGVIALGQFGNLSDSDFFYVILKGDYTRKLQKAALESLVRVGVEQSVDLLFDYIGEEGFSKISRKLLAPRITSNEKERLLEAYINGNEIARRSVKDLLQYLPDEDQALCLMKLALRFPEFITILCCFLVSSNFYCARDAKKQEMVAMYDHNTELFDTETKKGLEFIFKRWR